MYSKALRFKVFKSQDCVVKELTSLRFKTRYILLPTSSPVGQEHLKTLSKKEKTAVNCPMFATLPKTNFNFRVTFIVSANAFICTGLNLQGKQIS